MLCRMLPDFPLRTIAVLSPRSTPRRTRSRSPRRCAPPTRTHPAQPAPHPRLARPPAREPARRAHRAHRGRRRVHRPRPRARRSATRSRATPTTPVSRSRSSTSTTTASRLRGHRRRRPRMARRRPRSAGSAARRGAHMRAGTVMPSSPSPVLSVLGGQRAQREPRAARLVVRRLEHRAGLVERRVRAGQLVEVVAEPVRLERGLDLAPGRRRSADSLTTSARSCGSASTVTSVEVSPARAPIDAARTHAYSR